MDLPCNEQRNPSEPGDVLITINSHYHHYCVIALTLSYLNRAKTGETVIHSGRRCRVPPGCRPFSS
ncbi:protein of unknown function [Agrobacterium pusense]|uniref:Uncharacterized protein n=1 Tax=Agrobacterium pusense TaxID=648995 RepID=U4PQK2_9HYPH|nr:protein of unknown function [Agrobacterium pusense]